MALYPGAAAYLALGVDVADIGSDTCLYVLGLAYMACMGHVRRTGCQADIVEGELANPGVELQEEGQRLANATGGTENGDLGRLQNTQLASCFNYNVLLFRYFFGKSN
jgi:hypothetical protein